MRSGDTKGRPERRRGRSEGGERFVRGERLRTCAVARAHGTAQQLTCDCRGHGRRLLPHLLGCLPEARLLGAATRSGGGGTQHSRLRVTRLCGVDAVGAQMASRHTDARRRPSRAWRAWGGAVLHRRNSADAVRQCRRDPAM